MCERPCEEEEEDGAYIEAIRLLLAASAALPPHDGHAPDGRESYLREPARLAARAGLHDVVAEFAAHARDGAAAEAELEALFEGAVLSSAVEGGHLTLVSYLLDVGVKPGVDALMAAINARNADMVRCVH